MASFIRAIFDTIKGQLVRPRKILNDEDIEERARRSTPSTPSLSRSSSLSLPSTAPPTPPSSPRPPQQAVAADEGLPPVVLPPPAAAASPPAEHDGRAYPTLATIAEVGEEERTGLVIRRVSGRSPLRPLTPPSSSSSGGIPLRRIKATRGRPRIPQRRLGEGPSSG